MKIFHWEGEPQRELDTAATTTITTTSIRILQLIIRSTAFTTSGVPPSSRMAYSYKYTARTHGTANEPYTPREVCDEPLIPHPTQIAWTYRGILSSSTSLAGDVHRGPKLGP